MVGFQFDLSVPVHDNLIHLGIWQESALISCIHRNLSPQEDGFPDTLPVILYWEMVAIMRKQRKQGMKGQGVVETDQNPRLEILHSRRISSKKGGWCSKERISGYLNEIKCYQPRKIVIEGKKFLLRISVLNPWILFCWRNRFFDLQK